MRKKDIGIKTLQFQEILWQGDDENVSKHWTHQKNVGIYRKKNGVAIYLLHSIFTLRNTQKLRIFAKKLRISIHKLYLIVKN